MKANIYLKGGQKVVLTHLSNVKVTGDGEELTRFAWESENGIPARAEKALFTNLSEVAMITTEDR